MSETMARARASWRQNLDLPPGEEERPFVIRHEFTDAVSFIRALHPFCDWWRNPLSWIFRGQADAEWPLLPSAHRPEPWVPFHESSVGFDPRVRTEEQRSAHERALVLRFYEAAETQGLPLPVEHLTREAMADIRASSWPTNRIIPLMALAQHHGVPTRLLDWTRNARVAAHFSTLPPRKSASHLAVWAFGSAVLKQLEKEGPAGCFLRTVPRASNPNLHAQSAVCTFQRHPSDELEPFECAISRRATEVFGSEVQPSERVFIRKLTLPRVEVALLVTLLRAENISSLTLFPGFRGVVEELMATSKLNRDTEFAD